ncbi:hypothetical protein J3R83DRAFT_1131 [Lanmaoa asiatica]|nr:hypothetical protein J3R83DRAFT_1131 [Lanmaoa asiatica]
MMPPKRKAPEDNATPKRVTRRRQQPIADAKDEPDELNLAFTKPLVPPSTPGPRPGPSRLVMDCVEITTPRAIALRSSAACASPTTGNYAPDLFHRSSQQIPSNFHQPLRESVLLIPHASLPQNLQHRPNDVPVTPSGHASRPPSPKKGSDLTSLPSPVKLPGVLPAHLVPCLRLQKRAILDALQSPLSWEDTDDHGHLSTNGTAYTQLHSLLYGTTTRGEGNSCLLLGPRGSGKTSLTERAIKDLPEEPIVLRLSGHTQHNDRLALREIARQLSQQTGKSFLRDPDEDANSTGEEPNPFIDPGPTKSIPPPSHLPALISVLPTLSRPTVVILDAFDLFAQHARQSLLYCLLDTVQSCKVGQEKRVKSRFSGRMIRTSPPSDLLFWINISRRLLNTPVDDPSEWGTLWSFAVHTFLEDRKVVDTIKDTFALTRDVRMLKQMLTAVVTNLRTTSPFPTASHISAAVSTQRLRKKFSSLQALPYPSTCLLVATMHAHSAGHDMITFEMLYDAFREEFRASAAAPVQIEGGSIGMAKCTREVLMRSFEELVGAHMFTNVAAPSPNIAPEFVRYRCLVERGAVKQAVNAMGQTNVKKCDYVIYDPCSETTTLRAVFRMKPTSPTDLFTLDYANESDIDAFKAALQLDEHDHFGTASPSAYPGTPIPQSPRIRKVSALSDFAPINLKVKRRRKGERSPEHRQDWLFLLLRWPLLVCVDVGVHPRIRIHIFLGLSQIFIFVIIAAQFSLYIFIRQVVNTKEWLSAWRGRKGELRRRLRASRTYEEWKESALTLDRYLDFQEWKRVDEDSFYDWKLVKKVQILSIPRREILLTHDQVNRSLKILRERNDVRGVLGVLETCIRSNFAGVESPRLYSEGHLLSCQIPDIYLTPFQTFLGTKNLIESYHDEQERALRFIRESTELSNEEKKRFFKSASTNLGTSALCLSGGASFGYYHVGVVKAFLDAGLLPRVIAGTSAGGLIAALVCTRTEEELKTLLVPELAHKLSACDEPLEVWMKRFWKTGARFDSVTWARKSAFFTRGSMTFREAYLRTGRILNISVIPADRHSPTKLLNYVTAPDTVIWSALLASAAVPGILNPVVLMQKLRDGRLVPWNWGSKFKDGSLRVDIPIQALNLYFNVTHPVVSQVNPHVHLFFFAPRGSAGKPVAHRKGKGWRGNFLLSAAEQWLKLELTKNFKVIRDLELLPQLLGQDWSSVFLQRFDGTVTYALTIFNDWDWSRILSDPDPAELQRMIRVGELVTWPKLHIIENRYRIEQQIMLGRRAVRHAIQRARSKLTPTDTDSVINDSNASKPSTGTRPPGTSTTVEPPFAMDTDTEKAFADNGTAWYFRRGRPTVNHTVESGMSTPGDAGYTITTDPLRSPVLRRKWASDLLESRGSPDDDIPTTPDYSPTPRRASGSAKSTFFTKMKRKSVSALAIPFPSPLKSPRAVKSKEPSPNRHEPPWSSDSSSGEDGRSLYDSKSIRAAGLSSLMQDVEVDPDYGGVSEDDVDSD